MAEKDFFLDINREIISSITEWKRSTDLLRDKIKKYENDTKNRLNTIREMVNSKDLILGKEYDDEYFKYLVMRAEEMIKYNMPPGNSRKDLSKEGFKYWNDIRIPAKYGDIFLWLEILEFVKNNERFNRIVLVTDDTKKGDWISDKTSDLFSSMHIEISNANKNTSLTHMENTEFYQMFSSSDLTKAEIVKDEKLYSTRDKQEDTIVVPAKEGGFIEVFLGKNQWFSVRISNDRLSDLKYIAAYQSAPISKVTHYAKIETITESPYEEGKKLITFDGDPIELEHQIPLGSNVSAMQSTRYTNFQKLFTSDNIDDLFDQKSN